MAVRTTQQVLQQVEHDESLFKNEKDRMQMPRNALTTKVCLKYKYVCGIYQVYCQNTVYKLTNSIVSFF